MTPKERIHLISDIADRAILLADSLGTRIEKLEMFMDIDYADRACPLKLVELASAPQVDFAHDVFGIRRHLNRETKTLGNCFLPRYAV